MLPAASMRKPARNELMSTLPVLLISGFTEEDPRGLADVTDRYAFLSKPFKLRELTATLGRLLNKAEEQSPGD